MEKVKITNVGEEDSFFALEGKLINQIGTFKKHIIWENGYSSGEFVPDNKDLKEDLIGKEYAINPNIYFYELKVEQCV